MVEPIFEKQNFRVGFNAFHEHATTNDGTPLQPTVFPHTHTITRG